MRHPHGLIGWTDLMTSDVESARGFYSALFGWTSTDMPTPMGPNYTQFFKDGQLVCGMAPMPPDAQASGMPSTWNSYVIVENLDEALALVAGAGGQVVMPAMDVMTQGRMAMVTDASGAVIGLWQPMDHQGAQVFHAPGSVTWTELQSRDLDAAKRFYSQVFGWQWELSEPGADYWIALLEAKQGDDKSVGGGMPCPDAAPPEMPSTWFVYFAVDDCDAAVARAIDLGGAIFFGPMETGPGRSAGITDPTGGMFMVMAMNH